MFKGKKTYITALASFAYAAFGLYNHTLTPDEAFQIVQVALSAAFIRDAIGGTPAA